VAAASGLELAENVRLNNFLPTAVSDALKITRLFAIDLLQDGILPSVLLWFVFMALGNRLTATTGYY
jgi:hypothetical protein